MGDGGNYHFEEFGPSPELEALWGPTASAPAAPTAPEQTDPEEQASPVGPEFLLPALVAGPGRTWRRNRVIVGGIAGAIVAVLAGAGALWAQVGGERPRTDEVSKAADRGGDSGRASEEGAADSDMQAASENAQAFLERWKAGPATTMPLGAAGVPLEERPTTTTTTSVRMRPAAPAVTTAPKTVAAAPALNSDDPRLQDAERAANDFVDAISRRDCEAVWGALSRETIAFFDEMSDGDSQAAKDEFCAALAEPDELPTITLHPPARPYGAGAVIEIEADGEVDDLFLALEDGRWKVDLLGGEEESYADEEYATGAEADLDDALVSEFVYYSDYDAYTDDLDALREIEPAIDWRAGVAPSDAPAGAVYVAIADRGQTVCLSSRDADGVRHMVKDNADSGTTYASGAIPATCDGAPLPEEW